ncbi:hypothetical protein B0H19DRAFT_1064721 [Mycena capillaripes]|nr:hypothetical protein B0H19DRAFT_1064721 [Mycena capillaripes]
MSSAVSFNPDTTLGAYELGVLVSYILFGVTTTQMYIYYHRFPDDSLNLKTLVAFVWYALTVDHVQAPKKIVTGSVRPHTRPKRNHSLVIPTNTVIETLRVPPALHASGATGWLPVAHRKVSNVSTKGSQGVHCHLSPQLFIGYGVQKLTEAVTASEIVHFANQPAHGCARLWSLSVRAQELVNG